MNKQEFYRAEYKKINPQWQDSLTIYRDLIKEQLQPNCKVLDIGCGYSDYLQPIFTPDIDTYGLDLDEQALAKNTLIKHKVVGGAEIIPFADNFFDLVITAWVMEHLANPEQAFKGIFRVLKPGGQIIFITPNDWNYNVWLIRLIPSFMHDFFTRKLYGRQEHDTFKKYYRINSISRINKILTASGFKQVQLIANGDPSYISFNNWLFKLSCLIEKILNLGRFNQFKVHLLGVFKK
jgi:SAM-dependent methyltransferase